MLDDCKGLEEWRARALAAEAALAELREAAQRTCFAAGDMRPFKPSDEAAAMRWWREHEYLVLAPAGHEPQRGRWAWRSRRTEALAAGYRSGKSEALRQASEEVVVPAIARWLRARAEEVERG